MTLTPRPEMEAALKAVVLPALRAEGFKGSLPHLRRATSQGLDLLSFQFHWGAFTVEIARCKPSGIYYPTGGHTPANKATALRCISNLRKRIGPTDREEWYQFQRDPPEAIAQIALERLTNPLIWIDVSYEGGGLPRHIRDADKP